MRSKLRFCPLRGWLKLAVCALAISLSFYSCTISVDVNASPRPAPSATTNAPSVVRDEGGVRGWFTLWSNWISPPADPRAGVSPPAPVVDRSAAAR